MDRSALYRFSELTGVNIVFEDADSSLTAYFENIEGSPLMQDEDLRGWLRIGADERRAPYLFEAGNHVYFSTFSYGGGWLYVGPMCRGRLDASQRAAFFRGHHVEPEKTSPLRGFTLRQIRDITYLAATLLKGTEVEEEEAILLESEKLSEERLRRERHDSASRTEEARDEEIYHHTYYEEQQITQAILEGRDKDAIRISERLDSTSGVLSNANLPHWRSLAIVCIALVTRVAINAGVSPTNAYALSDYYINKCNEATEPGPNLYFRNKCIEDLCALVRKVQLRETGSGYTGKCKDYIQKHFREKITLEDIAAPLGISTGYLSREFKKNTGVTVQDYINQVRVERASNLLIYSDFTLSAIADYVHFPTQSYFGKMFKRYKGMTPNEFRKQHRVNEFWQY